MSTKVALITEYKPIEKVFMETLSYLFGDALKISAYNVEEGTALNEKKESVFIISAVASTYFDVIRKTIPENGKIILAEAEPAESNLDILYDIPEGTEAILCSSTAQMSMETIVSLHKMGVNHIKFVPWYRGCTTNIDMITTAVTTGFPPLVPNSIQHMYDIKNRQFDAKTILSIAYAANCEFLLETPRFKQYFNYISKNQIGIERLIETRNKVQKNFNGLAHMLNIGILGVDENNQIFICNSRAAELLRYNKSELLYQDASLLLSDFPFISCMSEGTTQEIVLKKSDQLLSISFTPLCYNNQYSACFAILTPMGEGEAVKHQLNANIMKKGYSAKYTFKDIIGESKAIIDSKTIAAKVARTESNVLLMGETGTGKELFAHSIHNSSSRKNYPFVAINCAALPENLMESELFGYEEGSFTGAKKGGKIGLFEIVGRGSIFLDEIENMSPKLQIKLLRVLQEREMIRVGGDRVIPFLARVITATNEDLRVLVKNNLFRQDLYYRINILPVKIPPLRLRGDDVFLLMNCFKENFNSNFVLSKEAQEQFSTHPWYGNIRELRNCVEYLSCLDELIIEVSNLPWHSEWDMLLTGDDEEYSQYGQGIINKIQNYNECNVIADDEILTAMCVVASCLYAREKAGLTGTGRKQICEWLEQHEEHLTEGQIRRILNQMKYKKFVYSKTGRGGSRLTALGKKVFLDI